MSSTNVGIYWLTWTLAACSTTHSCSNSFFAFQPRVEVDNRSCPKAYPPRPHSGHTRKVEATFRLCVSVLALKFVTTKPMDHPRGLKESAKQIDSCPSAPEPALLQGDSYHLIGDAGIGGPNRLQLIDGRYTSSGASLAALSSK